MTERYVITEEIAKLIDSQLTNKKCKKCPYEGGGINSGIKAHLRINPLSAELQKDRENAFENTSTEDLIKFIRACLNDEISRDGIHMAIHERIGYTHDDEIRRQERERVLNELIKLQGSAHLYNGKEEHASWIKAIDIIKHESSCKKVK